MLSDFHMHTDFSGDCDIPAQTMIEQAISLSMKQLCITDHYDYDYPDEPELFLIDFDKYFEKMSYLKEKYSDKIDLRIGVELGLQPHIAEHLKKISQKYPFDFIIGSSHVVDKCDPYYPSFFEGRDEKASYKRYFETISENLLVFDDVDVYGHIDYVVRYGPNKDKYYSYEDYSDVIDTALSMCIEHGVGIELNTGGLAYGLKHPNPREDVIKRYRELGGEIITVGADAHKPERIAYEFSKAGEILKQCGFKYYTVFKDRKPEFIKL